MLIIIITVMSISHKCYYTEIKYSITYTAFIIATYAYIFSIYGVSTKSPPHAKSQFQPNSEIRFKMTLAKK